MIRMWRPCSRDTTPSSLEAFRFRMMIPSSVLPSTVPAWRERRESKKMNTKDRIDQKTMKCPIHCSTTRSLTFLLFLQLLTNIIALKLSGQRVLVTGAGRGIGQAIAKICHSQGAKVAIASRTPSQLEETARLLEQDCDTREDPRVSQHVADVTVDAQVDSMVQEVVNRWGGIDILVNNAGRGQSVKGPMSELEADELMQLLNLNVVAVQRVTRAVLRHAQPKQIVQISSKAGKVGLPNYSFYVASKFALEGLTASLAAELSNTQVNSISPGMVDTVSFPKPPGRPGVRSAESIADGLLVLLGSSVTGHYLHVDELDEVRRRGLDDKFALKPINEPDFVSTLPQEEK